MLFFRTRSEEWFLVQLKIFNYKEKIDKVDYIEIKDFVSPKDPLKKQKS